MKKSLMLALCLVVGVTSTCFASFSYEGKQVKKESEEGYFVFRYPELKGETTQESYVARAVNKQLATLVHTAEQDMENTWNKDIVTDVTVENKNSNFKSKDVDYVVTYLDNNVLSVNFTHTFAQGEKEALYFKDGWTFDLNTGKTLKWQDLVRPEDKPKANAAGILEMLHRGFKNREFVVYYMLDDVKDKLDNYYIGSAGYIHLQFNPYEVGPSRSGVIDLDTDFAIKEL